MLQIPFMMFIILYPAVTNSGRSEVPSLRNEMSCPMKKEFFCDSLNVMKRVPDVKYFLVPFRVCYSRIE